MDAASNEITPTAAAARTLFGPSALATPANAISFARLLVSPFLLALIATMGASWVTVVLWVVLSASDGLDGYLARRHGVTRSGAFLDPLADKVLVLGALAALVVAGVFWVVPVGLIAVREVAISCFRTYWGRRGLAVPATWWAKVKTVVQEVAIGIALFPPTADQRWLANLALWLAVGLTIVTGATYVHNGSRATRTLIADALSDASSDDLAGAPDLAGASGASGALGVPGLAGASGVGGGSSPFGVPPDTEAEAGT